MVCTANDLLEWKEFPKGLRVLLLDDDSDSSSQIKSKLEDMEYIVTSFVSEHEALSAIESKTERFHVAIVEISAHNNDQRYKFLEMAKDLPTIMMSREICLSTMMKCIALGAVEFLIKPLLEEKLRSIWQHVVHKAFSTHGIENSESLKPVKEFVDSILKLQQFSQSLPITVSEELTNDTNMDVNESDVPEKFPAPSTPQIKQGGRFLDDGDYHDQPNNSPVKETGEVLGQTKFVDITSENMDLDPPQLTPEVLIKEEGCSDGSKGSDKSSPKLHDKDDSVTLSEYIRSLNKESSAKNSSKPKISRKKFKVDWTSDLHKKFVQAVEQLGVDQAIPSRILELMKVDGLTRHNVASHLQKYRMNRRHILPKEEERRWPQPRNYYTQRPVMAYPPYQTNQTFPPGQVYPVWGHQSGPPQMWGPPTYPWQPVENWHWKPYPGMHADAWGCPVMPPTPHPSPTASYPQPQVQPAYRFPSPGAYKKHSVDTHPGDEVIDKVVKEAISKPWLPLPIGLKPPSTDGVVAELSRQGISTVPPHRFNHHHHHF